MLLQTMLSSGIIKKKSSKVKCEICGKEFERISTGHLKTHGITYNEYKKQFPDALLVSDGWSKKQREAHLGRHHTKASKQLMKDNHPHLSGEDAPMYGKHHTEKSKQKISENTPDRSGKNNPMYGRTGKKNPMHNKKHSDETKQLMRDNHPHLSGENHPMFGVHRCGEDAPNYGHKHTDESKQHMRDSSPHLSGKSHPMWKGGISYEPYCIKFDNDLKERVREFFDRKCYVCGKSEKENEQKLSVHHVNYDKMMCCNDVKPLFVPLCMSCHGKTQKDREGWEEFFTISLEYLTGGECFLPKKSKKSCV